MELQSVLNRGLEFYRKEGLFRAVETGCIYGSAFAYYRWGGLRPHNTGGIDVFSEDWDNLILLDACRFDVFAEHARDELPGRLEKRTSRGSSTSEFVRANFRGDLTDVVYVSSNGWYLRLRDRLDCDLHAIYDVYRPDGTTEDNVVAAARAAAREHPDKRLLVHLLPPHHPFVGPTARETLPSYEEQQTRPFFERVRRGEIDVSDRELRQCYVENLARGTRAVSEILEVVEGKTVVSSDHGELLGERIRPLPVRYYGHIPSLYVPELVTVPWLVVDGERRETTADPPRKRINREFARGTETVDDRLRDLGYKV